MQGSGVERFGHHEFNWVLSLIVVIVFAALSVCIHTVAVFAKDALARIVRLAVSTPFIISGALETEIFLEVESLLTQRTGGLILELEAILVEEGIQQTLLPIVPQIKPVDALLAKGFRNVVGTVGDGIEHLFAHSLVVGEKALEASLTIYEVIVEQSFCGGQNILETPGVRRVFGTLSIHVQEGELV